MRANQNPSMPSRADLLRQRRAQNSQERVQKARKSASKVQRSQPVVVRGGFANAAVPIRQPKPSKVRKQFYYTVGASGAEIRLPAIPLVRPGARLLSFAVVVLTALAIYMLAFSQEFEVRQYKVEGIQRLTYADIEAVLGLEGTPVVSLNSQSSLEKLTAAFPELASAEMVVGFPAEVIISVVERQPVLAWQAGDTTYWLDTDGYLLPPRGEPGDMVLVEADSLPGLLPLAESAAAQTDGASILWGRQVDSLLLKIIFELTARLPADSKLVYNSLNGLGWVDPRGWDVFIGRDLENFQQKLSVYEAILANFEREGIYPREMVSVEFLNAPFYK